MSNFHTYPQRSPHQILAQSEHFKGVFIPDIPTDLPRELPLWEVSLRKFLEPSLLKSIIIFLIPGLASIIQTNRSDFLLLTEKDKNGRISSKIMILDGKVAHHQTFSYTQNTQLSKHSINAYHTLYEYNNKGKILFWPRAFMCKVLKLALMFFLLGLVNFFMILSMKSTILL